VRAIQVLAYLAGSVGMGVFGAFNSYTLSLWLTGYTSSYLLISLLGNTRSLEGAVVQPVTGAWSDRTWTGWLGRRRPFILVGGLVSAVVLAATPAVGRLPVPEALAWLPVEAQRLVPIVGAVFVFTLFQGVMNDSHGALLGDLTEGAARDRLGALRVVADFVGQVGILVLFFLLWKDGVPDTAFAVAGGLMAAGVLSTVVGVREPAPRVWTPAPREPHPPAARLRTPGAVGAVFDHYRGAAVFCLVVFFYWAGVNGVLPLVSIYTRDILGATVGESQLLPALLLLTTAALAIPMARLGTRYGKRRVIGAGFAIMGAAALVALGITTKQQGAATFVFAGVGNAACQALTLPLMADLVPRRHLGLAVGALAASASLSAPFASVAAGVLADAFGPRAIFAMMAAMVCVALALMTAVRTPEELLRPAAAPLA
jgi:Na+/melibiose symporter-like transporter